MEELDEKLIGKYQRVFNCSEGRDVLDDIREKSGVDLPFGGEIEGGELRHRTGWHDAFNYINNMVEYQGDEDNE